MATHPVKEALEFAGYRSLQWCARRVSFRTAGVVGASLAGAIFALTNIRKRITLENLLHAFPERTFEERLAIARAAFKSYGTALMEMMWTGTASEEDLRAVLHLKNPQVLHDALAQKKGVVLLSGHFGCWELIVNAFTLQFGQSIYVIAQNQRNKRINATIDISRRRFGSTTIPMGVSVREVLTALRKGEIVAMLGDQSGPKEALFVDFFGRPAATHRGAAVFALKTGAPMVMVLFVRQPDGKYEGVFESIDRSDITEYTDENVRELTVRHTTLLERYIRRYPEQWLWMHKRWKHTALHDGSTRRGTLSASAEATA